MRDAAKGGLEHADPAALGGPAQRSQPIAAETQGRHPGSERRRLAATGRPRGSGPVPRVQGRSPELAVGVPANGEIGTVGAADRDRPSSPHPLDDGSVRTWVRARQGFESQSGWRTGEVDVLFDGERDAVERRQLTATCDRPVGCLRGFESLLAENDRDGVDRGVHGLDPPQVGLDDFLTGRLPGSDCTGQFRGAHTPEVGGRDTHPITP